MISFDFADFSFIYSEKSFHITHEVLKGYLHLLTYHIFSNSFYSIPFTFLLLPKTLLLPSFHITEIK